VLVRRVRLLVAATITYNVVEAVVALTAGTAASSGALIGSGVGFGDRSGFGRRGRLAVFRKKITKFVNGGR
jgi:lactam utilization protein B